MKSVIGLAIVAMILLFAFTPQPKPQKEKVYKFEFTESQLQNLWSSIEFCKASIKTSQSPSVQVVQVTNTLDSIQAVIQNQYITQTQDTTKHKK